MAKKTHDEISKLFAKRFEDYNTKVLKDIAETIKQFKGLNYTEAHRLAQQLKYSRNYQQLINQLSTLSEETKNDIKELLDETAKQNLEFADVYYKARNMETPVYENNYRLQSLSSAVANVSSQDFNNIAQSTAFRMLDENDNIVYRNIGDTYNNVIDNCVYAVSTGQDTFDNVMRSTINQLAESGVRKVYYDNEGKRAYSQRLDSVVRRNILDSIRQINNETQIELGKEFGADGVEITVHDNPADDHFEVQGKQFSNDEFAKLMAEGKATDYKGKIIDIRRPRKKGGFFHRPISDYNCYHTAFAVILGVSDPLYSDEELQEINERNNTGVKIDGVHYTRYEATQLQRKIETEIRKSKDAHIMYKTTDDKVNMLKEQKRITQLTQKYNEIVNKGLPNDIKRSRVSGYKPSPAFYKITNKEWVDIKPPKKIPKMEKYYKNIGKEHFNNKSNSDLDKYVVQGKNMYKNMQKDNTYKEEMINVMNNIDPLKKAIDDNYVLYSGGSDFNLTKSKYPISTSLGKQTAKLYSIGEKDAIVNVIYAEKGAKLISTYNTSNNQFEKQAELIIPISELKKLKKIANGIYYLSK